MTPKQQVIGIVVLLAVATSTAVALPTLRDLVDPRQQFALYDTLSAIVALQYKHNEIGSDEAPLPPAPAHRFPSIQQLNGNYSDILFQGDILLPTKELVEMVDESQTRRKRTAYRNALYPTTIWKRGVPFAFHRSLSNYGRRSVLAAIQFFRSQTCIKFRRRTTEPVYLLFTGHDQGCWSTVGRAAEQRQQIVSIGPGCEPFGISSHEVAHALGLYHEQSRYDRDNWINIYPNRVPRALLYNFAKVSRRTMDTYRTQYDIGSVMHYTPFEFSVDPTVPSMVAVNINEQAAMGQLAGPSFRDVLILNRHYQCEAKCRRKIQCFNGGYQNPNACRRCKCPPGYGGKFCGTIQTPSIDRCSRKMIATKTPRRMRVRINENQFAKGARTCIFHIVAPYNARVQLIVDQVSGNCVPGCWREAAEFKVRHNKQTTGNRFCCHLTKPKKVLSNSPTVPFILKAVRKSAEIVFRFRFIERTPARDGDGTDDEVEVDDDEYVFDKPESEVDDEFEIDVQEALPLGTPPNADDLLEVPFHDGSSSEENPADYEEEMTKTLQELPPLDDDLELMVDDNDVVELEKPAGKTP